MGVGSAQPRGRAVIQSYMNTGDEGGMLPTVIYTCLAARVRHPLSTLEGKISGLYPALAPPVDPSTALRPSRAGPRAALAP